ncbi:hypothetical protein SEEHRA36_26183 [Salmonella enterica subsp. enterica serovar Heidelberg str. SARA36]|nr:hypothetical protein SEEHRA36_26183 [Salmonella enterica subsp. enterica serovar Heidelberg str. SARA36]
MIFILYDEYEFHLFYFVFFEHYPNFKLKIFVYIVAIHIAYYGCNGLT